MFSVRKSELGGVGVFNAGPSKNATPTFIKTKRKRGKRSKLSPVKGGNTAVLIQNKLTEEQSIQLGFPTRLQAERAACKLSKRGALRSEVVDLGTSSGHARWFIASQLAKAGFASMRVNTHEVKGIVVF